MNPHRLILLIALAFILAACSSGNIKPNAPAGDTGGTSTTPSKGGGYYLDDGPEDHPPENIDSIPDAEPHAEPLLARANRPYTALGVRYTPTTDYVPYKQTGIASWYGKRYHGQKTSSGEVYDMYAMTGAHTTLPIPSYARVTNPENGRSVIVRINDRGPFHSDRLIDLSYAAAYKLRLLEKGSGMVEVEAIDTRDPTQKRAKDLILTIPPAPPPPVFVDIPSHAVPESAARAASNKTEAAKPAATSKPAAAGEADAVPNKAGGDYVQVGVFKQKSNVAGLREKLQQQHLAENIAVESWYNAGSYRVRLGPYASRQDAEHAAARIKQALGISTIVIHQ